ncbi:TMEM18 isoform 6 [Pan troglodytes]|uniref:TMEM18 isoform 6 n=1 Tax=Pan troglodytes TaxID=9598 RepID=A0A2J8J652_PANTR|nr:TMEM18 isoform 6 [Pan troglodytes]
MGSGQKAVLPSPPCLWSSGTAGSRGVREAAECGTVWRVQCIAERLEKIKSCTWRWLKIP